MDIDKLKIFLALVREGSHTKVASLFDTNINKTSRYLKDVESYFGSTLLIRIKNNLQLTENGKKVFKFIEEIVHSNDQAINILHKKEKEKNKVFSILTTTGVSSLYLIDLFEKLEILNNAKIITTNESADIHIHDTDFIILPERLDGNFVHKKIATFRQNIYCSQSYLEKVGNIKSLNDLKKADIIGFYPNSLRERGNVDWILKLASESNKAPKKPIFIVNSALAQIYSASKGLGLVSLSFEISQFPMLEKLGLKKILENECSKEVDLFINVDKNKLKDPNIGYFYKKISNKIEDKNNE